MAMKATTVEILIDKAKLEPHVALAFAEAMDEAVDNRERRSQLVTVPILDGRLGDLRRDLEAKMGSQGEKISSQGERISSLGEKISSQGEKISSLGEKISSQGEKISSLEVKIESVKSELVRWVFMTFISIIPIQTAIMYFLLQHAR
jgi:predicted RNase H-like nuclease (RuvC/YqgF family)